MRITLCIPTLNPGLLAEQMAGAIQCQTLRPNEILVIDSESNDGSIEAYERIGAKIISIERKDFDHGGTRNIAFRESMADVYIFLTQDAIPVDTNALGNLVNSLTDHPSFGLVYGRQVPTRDAGAFARHARLYNYPAGDEVVIKKFEDVTRLGIKTAFCSNSFSAYRREAMDKIGFFAANTLFAEDSIAAAKLLQCGWQIGYVPQAMVVHSHDYSLKQDFCRYFDVGAFHSMNKWYMDFLGKAEAEGRRFVHSEYNYLVQAGIRFSAMRVVLRNAVRLFGYRLGAAQGRLPLVLKQRISTNKSFWLRLSESATCKGEKL